MKLSYIGAASALLALASAGPTPIPGIKKPPARGYSSENVGNCLLGPDEHDDPFGSNTDGDESPADDSCGSRNEPLTSNLDTEHGSLSAINSMSDPGEGDSLPDHPLQDGGAAIAATAASTPKEPNTRPLAASGHKSRFGYLPNSPSTHDHSYPQRHHRGIPNETPETLKTYDTSKTPETQGIFKLPGGFNFFKTSETPKTPEASETSEAPETPEARGIFKIPEFFNFFKPSETPKTPEASEAPKTPETLGIFKIPEFLIFLSLLRLLRLLKLIRPIRDIKNGEISKIGIESDGSVDKFRSQITKAHADAEQLKGSGLSLGNLAAELRSIQDKLDKDMAKYQNVQNDRFLSLKAEYNKVRKPKKEKSANDETAVEQASQDSSEMQSSSAPSHPVTDPEIE
ncbi:hypothetical protein BASA50_007034 [Batrachochytrium salamandrivorans]|uniref:Uncharacterized protein n=1 Tax=Batrachochytrium salamandrivorans TaxID=1357716 RepID=A0ABQ8F828_9FUNG|nr:hypothetical protein BASA50_007034 [Batrachochytrium salamandrivorans]